MSLGLALHLGGVLELEHGGVVVWLARRRLGGADKVTQRFGHVLHRVDQDHLQGAHTHNKNKGEVREVGSGFGTHLNRTRTGTHLRPGLRFSFV